MKSLKQSSHLPTTLCGGARTSNFWIQGLGLLLLLPSSRRGGLPGHLCHAGLSCWSWARLCALLILRPDWIGLWATWWNGWQPCPWQGSWNWTVFKVPSNSNYYMILWLHDSMSLRLSSTLGNLRAAQKQSIKGPGDAHCWKWGSYWNALLNQSPWTLSTNSQISLSHVALGCNLYSLFLWRAIMRKS